MVTRWSGPDGTATVSMSVAGTVAEVTVHDNRATHDGRSVTLDDLGQLLLEVQETLDRQVLAMPVALGAVTRLVELWRTTPNDGSGQWRLRQGRIEWHCTDGLLHVEVGDGGPYAQPMTQPFVDVLVDLGWNHPDRDFRNCWLQPPGQALEPAARIAVLTTMAAFGYPEPPPLP